MIAELLYELCQWDEIRLVIRNEDAIAELCGKFSVRESQDYLTLELSGVPHHAHVRRQALKRAEISSGDQGNCSVRFFNQEGQQILACYIPRTNKTKEDFDAARHQAFVELAQKYSAAEHVTVHSTQ